MGLHVVCTHREFLTLFPFYHHRLRVTVVRRMFNIIFVCILQVFPPRDGGAAYIRHCPGDGPHRAHAVLVSRLEQFH